MTEDRIKRILNVSTLIGVDLSNANLHDANLAGADLRWTNLTLVNFYRANLEGANLCNTNLFSADLCEAEMRGAKLYGAKLTQCNLYKANLDEAQLGRTNQEHSDPTHPAMKNTKRGLELTHDSRGGNLRTLLNLVRSAASAEAAEMQQHIDQDDAVNFGINVNLLAEISELWRWVQNLYCTHSDTDTVLVAMPKYAKHIGEHHEDMGVVLWWRDPIDEPPYVGTPSDTDFDETYKWFSPLDTPEIPKMKRG